MTLAERIIRRAQRTPYRHLPGYMERYWLKPYGGLFGIAARVHHILRSDDARAFHDHPWTYVTVILKGGYTEVTPWYDESGIYQGERRKSYHAGALLLRRATHWHRLELLPGEDTWTLFVTFKKRQRWGFMMQPANKVYWRDYLNDHTSEGTPDA